MEQNQVGGFELLYKIYEPTIKNKADIVILLTHYTLSMQCGMHCIGLDGAHCSKPTKYSEGQHSALLPVGWNKNNGVYKLYYYLNEELYKLTANSSSKGSLNIRLTNPSNGNTSTFEILLEKLISRKQRGTTPVKVFIPKAEYMVESLKANLVKPVLGWRRQTIINTESNGYLMANPSTPRFRPYTR
uniref:Putative proteasome inhibitor n=1 Tax=Zeugodacus cucurbitae TaxID=28588 RepID=A0A0A1XIH5_ZEUCU